MRTLTLFALALVGTAVLTDDASAIGRRKRGHSSSNSGCCGAPAMPVAASCCGGGVAGAPGMVYPGGMGYNPAITGGQQTVIQATDGQVYTLGADGTYYATSGAGTFGGYGMQPYRSGYTPGMYRGTTPYQNVYPAGYSGAPGPVYPAGGTPPLAMPGVMPPRR